MSDSPQLERSLRAFADRLFSTGGRDPGDEAIALPSARLELYRKLVRDGYESMLRFAYPRSLRLVQHELDGASRPAGAPATVRDLVVAFLADSPASTHSTREIADRFVAFLPRSQSWLGEWRPDLGDLLALERARLRADYHADDPGRAPSAEEIDALARARVEEFLALEVIRAPSCSVLRLRHPVLRLHAELGSWHVPAPGPPDGERVLVSRDPVTFDVITRAVTEQEALLVELAAPGEATTVEQLAARWVAKSPEEDAERDDAWRLRTLAEAIVADLRSGVLRVTSGRT